MNIFYAQINDDGICICISQLSEHIERSNMILIDSLDNSLLNKKYDNGVWISIDSDEDEAESQ